MFRFFNTNHPVVFINLFIYTLLLKGSFFFLPYFFYHDTPAVLNDPIFNALSGVIPGWQIPIHLLSILLVYLQAIVFNYILILNRLTKLQTYLPAMIFITLSSLRPEVITLNPANVSYILVLPVFFHVFRLPYQEQSAMESLFYSGLFIALASLFYFPASYLLLALLFAAIWLKTLNGREFLIPIIAYLLPYVFIGVYYYVIDELPAYWILLQQLLPETAALNVNKIGALILAGIVFIFVLAGYFKARNTPQQNIILYRKYMTVLLAFILIGLGYFFFVTGEQLLFGYILLAPISIFISNLYDVEKPGMFLRFVFWLLILLAFFFQWQYYLQTIGSSVLEQLTS